MFAITPPGGPEWIVIGLIFVLLFGAKKLPELGGSVGKSIRNFKKGVSEAGEDSEPGDDQPVSEISATEPPSGGDVRGERTPSGSSPSGSPSES